MRSWPLDPVAYALQNRCSETGHCHRHDEPLEQMITSAKVLAPEEIRAEILVLDMCWGFPAWGGLVDPRWGFAYKILRHGSVSALVTSWRSDVTTPNLIDVLSSEIASGALLGEAVAHYNRTRLAREAGHTMALFGSPLRRLVASGSYLPAGPYDRIEPRLQFMTMIGEAIAARGWTKSGKDEARRLLAATAAVPRDTGAVVKGFLDTVQASGGGISAHWHARAKMTASEEAHFCPNHPEPLPAVVYDARFTQPWIAMRRVKKCPSCGLTQDAPVSSEVRIAVDDGGVSVAGLPAGCNYAALLSIDSQDAAESVAHRWQSASRRYRYDLGTPWPRGVLDVSVTIVTEALDVHVASRRYRSMRA